MAPKSNCIQAPSSEALAQRVVVLPSIAMAADRPPFSVADEVAATGLMATPGLLTSTGTVGGGSGIGSCGGVVAGLPVKAWISKIE